MELKKTDATEIKEGRWNESTCIRITAGFSVDKTNFPAGMTMLPKGAPIAVVNNKAYLIKTAKAHASADSSATSLQVEKGHVLKVGDVINGSTISAITEGTDYDTLTISALGTGVSAGDIVADAKASSIYGLNYASVKVEDFMTCTTTIQAYEIVESSLPFFVSSSMKTALTSRHMFV